MVEVGKHMSRPGQSIPHDAMIQKAAKKMSDLKIGALLVIRDQECVGIVTDTDMTRKVIARGADLSSLRVESVMSSPLITVDEDDPLLEANRVMKEEGTRHLAVTKSGKVTGLISFRDVARYLDKFLGEEEEELNIKRGYIRLPFSAVVTYKDQTKREFEGITYDISAGGLFIQTQSPLPRGSKITMKFSLPEAQKTIQTKGTISWLRKKSEEFSFFPVTEAVAEVTYIKKKVQRKVLSTGMGVKFTNIAEKDRERIMHFIMKWAEANKKKEGK